MIAQQLYQIVAHCPACAAPIYGPQAVLATPAQVPLSYACQCHRALELKAQYEAQEVFERLEREARANA